MDNTTSPTKIGSQSLISLPSAKANTRINHNTLFPPLNTESLKTTSETELERIPEPIKYTITNYQICIEPREAKLLRLFNTANNSYILKQVFITTSENNIEPSQVEDYCVYSNIHTNNLLGALQNSTLITLELETKLKKYPWFNLEQYNTIKDKKLPELVTFEEVLQSCMLEPITNGTQIPSFSNTITKDILIHLQKKFTNATTVRAVIKIIIKELKHVQKIIFNKLLDSENEFYNNLSRSDLNQAKYIKILLSLYTQLPHPLESNKNTDVVTECQNECQKILSKNRYQVNFLYTLLEIVYTDNEISIEVSELVQDQVTQEWKYKNQNLTMVQNIAYQQTLLWAAPSGTTQKSSGSQPQSGITEKLLASDITGQLISNFESIKTPKKLKTWILNELEIIATQPNFRSKNIFHNKLANNGVNFTTYIKILMQVYDSIQNVQMQLKKEQSTLINKAKELSHSCTTHTEVNLSIYKDNINFNLTIANQSEISNKILIWHRPITELEKSINNHLNSGYFIENFNNQIIIEIVNIKHNLPNTEDKFFKSLNRIDNGVTYYKIVLIKCFTENNISKLTTTSDAEDAAIRELSQNIQPDMFERCAVNFHYEDESKKLALVVVTIDEEKSHALKKFLKSIKAPKVPSSETSIEEKPQKYSQSFPLSKVASHSTKIHNRHNDTPPGGVSSPAAVSQTPVTRMRASSFKTIFGLSHTQPIPFGGADSSEMTSQTSLTTTTTSSVERRQPQQQNLGEPPSSSKDTQ